MLASEVGSPAKRYHYHVDHLGTPRLITGNGGVEISRHTYLPFGVEVGGTPGHNPLDGEWKKFTGHERDQGSIDYMLARYYNPFMARFLSVDPARDVAAALSRPQRWNRYAYVVNNPLTRLDPDGRRDKFFVFSAMGFNDSSPSDKQVAAAARSAGKSAEVTRRATRDEIVTGLSRIDDTGTDVLVIASHTFDNNRPGNHEELATWQLVGWGSLSATELATALGDGKPAAIVLFGCSTAGMAQDIASATGVPTLGMTGDFNQLVGFSDFEQVIDDALQKRNGSLSDGTEYRLYDDERPPEPVP